DGSFIMKSNFSTKAKCDVPKWTVLAMHQSDGRTMLEVASMKLQEFEDQEAECIKFAKNYNQHNKYDAYTLVCTKGELVVTAPLGQPAYRCPFGGKIGRIFVVTSDSVGSPSLRIMPNETNNGVYSLNFFNPPLFPRRKLAHFNDHRTTTNLLGSDNVLRMSTLDGDAIDLPVKGFHCLIEEPKRRDGQMYPYTVFHKNDVRVLAKNCVDCPENI
ncbi:hypothetical protein PMAYCL1PPCAC_22668, partial [Pristionchus mayeri]